MHLTKTVFVLLGEEAEVEEEEEEEEQKGPDLKQASRRDMYSICQSAGLGLYILHKNNSMYFFYFIYLCRQSNVPNIFPGKKIILYRI